MTFQKWVTQLLVIICYSFLNARSTLFFSLPFLTLGTEVWSPSCSGASCWMPGCAGCRCTAGLHPEWFGTWPYLSKIDRGPALAFFQVLGMQSIHDILVGLSYVWHFVIDVWFDCLMPGRRTASCTKYLKAFRRMVPCHESMQLPWIWHVCIFFRFWVLTVQLFLWHGKIIIWAKRLASALMIWHLSSPGVVQSFGYLLRQKWRVDYTSPTWCQHFQSNGYRWYWMNMYENGWTWQFTEQCHLLQNPPLQYYKRDLVDTLPYRQGIVWRFLCTFCATWLAITRRLLDSHQLRFLAAFCCLVNHRWWTQVPNSSGNVFNVSGLPGSEMNIFFFWLGWMDEACPDGMAHGNQGTVQWRSWQ